MKWKPGKYTDADTNKSTDAEFSYPNPITDMCRARIL